MPVLGFACERRRLFLSISTRSLVTSSFSVIMPKTAMFACHDPFHRHRRHAKEKATLDKDLISFPIMHPDFRPRALILPIPPDKTAIPGSETMQKTIDQSLSPLFSMLPPEIRLLIYRFVLGNKKFHMFHDFDCHKLANVRCIVPHSRKHQRSYAMCKMPRYPVYTGHCWGAALPNGMNTLDFASLDLPPRPWGLLALLRTCRQV